MIWVLSTVLLTMGGLVREKALGAAPFTLSLPVSRRRVLALRVLVCSIQAILLAVLPWMSMFLVEVATYGKADSPQQAFFHLLLLIGGGAVVFGFSVLMSSVIEGEYTTPFVTLGVVLVAAIALNGPVVRQYNPLSFMGGGEYLDRNTYLLQGSMPWLQAGVYLAIASLFVTVSARLIERRDF